LKIRNVDQLVHGSSYESSLHYVLRCMIDKDLVGMGWITLQKFDLVKNDSDKTSFCDWEVRCRDSDIISNDFNDEKWSKIVPLRILSFDIEVLTPENNLFPKPEEDPVITIGITFTDHINLEKNSKKFVLQLNSCSKLLKAHVIQCRSEEHLLYTFAKMIVSFDPDIITGYNIENFDFKYLIERSKKLGIEDMFLKFSRFRNIKVSLRQLTTYNQVMGDHDAVEILC